MFMATWFTYSATACPLTNPSLPRCHGNMPTEMWCKFNIHLISLLPPMCWPQRVPRSMQLQHPHSVNKPNTTGNQLQLLQLPLTPCWSVVLAVLPPVGWHCWQCFIHAIHETLCASILPPASFNTLACTLCSPVYLWTALRFFNCNLSYPLWLLRSISLRFGLLSFSSLSLCASLLHFIWLACNLFWLLFAGHLSCYAT